MKSGLLASPPRDYCSARPCGWGARLWLRTYTTRLDLRCTFPSSILDREVQEFTMPKGMREGQLPSLPAPFG